MNDNGKTKQLHDFEQGAAIMADSLPPYWWRLYSNMVREGFSEEQAMRLLATWIVSCKTS